MYLINPFDVLAAVLVTIVAVLHAEVTVLNEATKRGSPLALGVTITVCTEESKRSDTCRLDIANSGGIITPDQHGAYWPANNL